MCKENIDLVPRSVRPFGPGTLDEWAKLWHPDTRVTVPEEQPEFLPTN
jgi:ketosteroid isomerase-like protein